MTKLNSKKFITNISLFVVLPFIINIVLESLGNKSILGGFVMLFNSPYVFFANVMIVAFTLSFGALFGRFRDFWIGFVGFVWILLVNKG